MMKPANSYSTAKNHQKQQYEFINDNMYLID